MIVNKRFESLTAIGATLIGLVVPLGSATAAEAEQPARQPRFVATEINIAPEGDVEPQIITRRQWVNGVVKWHRGLSRREAAGIWHNRPNIRDTLIWRVPRSHTDTFHPSPASINADTQGNRPGCTVATHAKAKAYWVTPSCHST